MDLETLYTATKWDILKLLESQNLSPIEISSISGSSLANVSQQLRLLEMAGIVKSERVSNRDKGQPRVVYSLAQDNCYVISTANSFVDKKRLSMGPSHQVVLKIWFLDNPELRIYCEKAFWKIEEFLPQIDAIYVDPTTTSPVSLYVVSKNTLPVSEIQQLKLGEETRQCILRTLDYSELEEIKESLIPLFERNNSS